MISTICGQQSDEIMDLCNLIYDNVWFQKISITPPPPYGVRGQQVKISKEWQGSTHEESPRVINNVKHLSELLLCIVQQKLEIHVHTLLSGKFEMFVLNIISLADSLLSSFQQHKITSMSYFSPNVTKIRMVDRIIVPRLQGSCHKYFHLAVAQVLPNNCTPYTHKLLFVTALWNTNATSKKFYINGQRFGDEFKYRVKQIYT